MKHTYFQFLDCSDFKLRVCFVVRLVSCYFPSVQQLSVISFHSFHTKVLW